ncbi:salivary peroxidase/catechol oxidase-like isoform X2 [Cherax quadricarinatus]|uniref:salivary peroxidase/catechol oxidase-like isoform X2 n=1 Tax=Cherax quadricarinatus TaxID=27406 RepID=UPI00387EDEFF
MDYSLNKYLKEELTMLGWLVMVALVVPLDAQVSLPGERPWPGARQGQQEGDCSCVLLVDCASHLDEIQQSCEVDDGVAGVCCPVSEAAAGSTTTRVTTRGIFSPASVSASLPSLDSSKMAQSLNAGLNRSSIVNQVEENLIENAVILPRDSPAGQHLLVFTINKEAKEMDRNAMAIITASSKLVHVFSLSPRQGSFGLHNLPVSGTSLESLCPQVPTCTATNSKYRTADGSCNNLAKPSWGMSNTPNQRILPPTYEDGVFEPRATAADGSPLPGVRHISSNVLLDVNKPDEIHTSSLMVWAQFIDHELAHVPFPTMDNGEGIQCCPNGTLAPAALRHPRCMPIDLTGDAFYGPQGRTCMNFVRSMVAVGAGSECVFGYAEQLNQITHWIDGSVIYGSTADQMHNLRALRNGLMKISGNNLLPINSDQSRNCAARIRGALCFMAGDSRVNEQPGLTAIHTLWLRQHNRVAEELQKLNPQWSDEAVFQEARRIIVAQEQHIIFNEWLPIIIGKDFMRTYGLSTLRSGFSNDYNPSINPNMNNEFSAAAFRFGHSMVQGTIRLFTRDGGVDTVRLRDHFNSPHLIELENRLDDLVRSFTQHVLQKLDAFITQDLSNHLFQTPRFNFGMDLMSLNIQRGRDHGIATYNSLREKCGLPRARTFNDLTDQISPENVQKLARVYKSVDDIDFFVGGITERSVPGSLLGWTFLCVVGDQFARLKKGDRYFYDLGGQPSSFSEAQLQQIRRSSWARIICDNSDVGAVQPLAFRQTNNRFNRPVPCNSPIISRPHWTPWRGERAAA